LVPGPSSRETRDETSKKVHRMIHIQDPKKRRENRVEGKRFTEQLCARRIEMGFVKKEENSGGVV